MMAKKTFWSNLILISVISTQSLATVLNIDEMNITSGTITRNFLPTPDTINLKLTENTDLVGGYINKNTSINGKPISISNFGMPGGAMKPPQYVYTAASNINHNEHPNAPLSGLIQGGPVPTGVVDDVKGTINMDLSSWFANHMIMDQNLGSENASGTWDAATGNYELSWTAKLRQGMAAGGTITWNLQGNILKTSPVPVPGAIWFLGTALLGLPRFKKNLAS